MKNIIFILLSVLFLGLNSMAQVKLDKLSDSSEMRKPLKFGVTAGTSFTTNFNNLSGFSYFAAPQMSYQISPKFHIKSGLAVSRTNYFGSFRTSENNTMQSNLTSNGVFGFVSGEYAVNPKITISGTAFYGKQFFDGVPYNQRAFNVDTKGVSMDVRYNVSDNITIGLGVSVVDGYRPYSQDPFNPYSSHRNGQNAMFGFSPLSNWGFMGH